jgi:hypothetical protein
LVEFEAAQIDAIVLGQHFHAGLRNVAIESKIATHARAAIALRDLAFRQTTAPEVFAQFDRQLAPA